MRKSFVAKITQCCEYPEKRNVLVQGEEMKKRTRERLMSGEPRTLDDGGAYYEFCCDCDLTHFFTVDVDCKNKKVTLCYYRDDYDTELFRKENNIVIYQRRKKRGKTTKTKSTKTDT